MRAKSQVAHHCRHVLPGPGRSADMSFGAHAPEFSLAHLVAFQHPILHSISGRDGIHRDRDFKTPTESSRKSAHAFYYCQSKKMKKRCVGDVTKSIR